MAKNIIVSNRLPIQLTKLDNSFEFTSTSGGLATGLKSVHEEGDSLWIGWPGISDNSLDKKNKNQINENLSKNQQNINQKTRKIQPGGCLNPYREGSWGHVGSQRSPGVEI